MDNANRSQHVHFVGIGGTLMGSLAQLAKQAGLRVTGSDQAVYPPMSDQLAAAGITYAEGFDPDHFNPAPDLVVLGNAGLPRGHPAVEYVLEQNLPYTSGAQWLGDTILRDRWVLAVAGTHGKTTTASMLAWILRYAGLNPGYLIGGAPLNLGASADLGESPFFVVEADEYDCSYFDRRSKFVHYRPRTLVINNLEYDHADIFEDLHAIQTQFHNLLRTVPANGLVLAPINTPSVQGVLDRGLWSQLAYVSTAASTPNTPTSAPQPAEQELWGWESLPGRAFRVLLNNKDQGTVNWGLTGVHNRMNALNAIAAARHAGVPVGVGIQAMSEFQGVKRRMEVIFEHPNFTLYDDFAHHPTAIASTVQGLRSDLAELSVAERGAPQIVAVIEPRTHTMSLGTLKEDLITCPTGADRALWFKGANIKWDLDGVVARCPVPSQLFTSLELLVSEIVQIAEMALNENKPVHVVIMSNGAFGGIYKTLSARLNELVSTAE